MALKDLFNAQSLNQAFPSRLPGTAHGWDTAHSCGKHIPSVGSDWYRWSRPGSPSAAPRD